MTNRFLQCLGSAALGTATLHATAHAQEGPFLPDNGLVVVEFETGDAAGSWSRETALSGFTGSEYLRWDGPNLFQTPGHDVFGFDFQIDDPGRYHFRIHNRHDHPDSTEANDVWIRMDGGPWIKTFSWQRGQWTWATQHEFSHTHKPPAEYQLGSGLHRIEFSGRSHDFMIDRFHLYADNVQNPLSTSHPESQRAVIDSPPIAIAQVSPAAIPENDNFTTVVTLDSRRSFDPEGENVTVRWNVRGARFVQGTNPSSRVARVKFRGGFAVPVQLVVTDGQHRAVDFAYVNVESTDGTVGGAGCEWHPVTIDFEGPTTDENATGPNPFLDYRLNVTLTAPGAAPIVVPGFYDGDGQGNGSGNVWRVRFTPDRPGVWEYEASFRTGEDVAISLDPSAGSATHFDGASGTLGVMQRDPLADGFLAKGRLDYIGGHHLQHQGTGETFIKTGTNSPENFLAYAGFDDVQDNGGVGIIHEYSPHVADWLPGDPFFVSSSTGVNSRGIIGALNYLGSQGVNALYFLPMNLGGDGQDTTPFVGYSNTSFNKTHYDISRLNQWNMTLNHAQEKGIMLHFVLAETEAANENWLDNGTMGTERKLFFRELASRFSYLNGVKWTLSEENDYSVATLREMATYMRAIDVYQHPIAVHTHPNDVTLYQQIVGDPLFDAASVQYDTNLSDNLAETVRNMSNASGRRWIVDMDENGSWNVGVSSSNAGQMRCEVLYDVLFSGGGIEWYAGYHDLPLGGDVKLENFRTREEIYRYSRIAREFLEEHIDVTDVSNADNLVTGENGLHGGAEVMYRQNRDAVMFLPSASQTPTFDLSNTTGTFRVRWFDPRTGDEVAQGPSVQGGAPRQIQVMAPNPNLDWIVFFDRQ